IYEDSKLNVGKLKELHQMMGSSNQDMKIIHVVVIASHHDAGVLALAATLEHTNYYLPINQMIRIKTTTPYIWRKRAATALACSSRVNLSL
ncbi:hypothetical protein ACJX0J_037825, partial [Zea mays]